MRWPWQRKRNMPPINEDWAPGDLAECIAVDHSYLLYRMDLPRVGTKYIVTAVYAGKDAVTLRPGWGLDLVSLVTPPKLCYPAVAFRKVLPDAFEEPRATARKRERVG